MNKGPLLSIIIPVYNTKVFLGKCLDSVEDQGIKKDELEIICIDDGSTDGSGIWLDIYAQKHHNVKVIHKTNGGECSARNCGLAAMHGKYFEFVDSDDRLVPNSIYDIVKEMERTDCSVAQFEYVSEERDGKIMIRPPKSNAVYVSRNHKHFSMAPISLTGSVWRYIFSRKAFGHLRFDEELRYAGDTFFVQTVSLYNLKCLHSSAICYVYNQSNPNSLMAKRDFLQVAENMMRLAKNHKVFLNQKAFPQSTKRIETWHARAIAGYIYYLLRGGKMASPFKELKTNGLWPYKNEWKLLIIHFTTGGFKQTLSNYCLFFVGFRPIWWVIQKGFMLHQKTS